MNAHSLATILRKHKQEVVVVFVSIVTAVTAITFSQAPVYRANATVLFKSWDNTSAAPAIHPRNGRIPVSVTLEDLINTEIEILTGRDLIQEAIAAVTLESLYPGIAKGPKKSEPMIDAVRTFENNLVVDWVPKTSLITVSFRHGDPELAAKCVNLLINLYKKKHLLLYNNPQSQLVDSQFVSSMGKLHQSERDLQEYQRKHRAFQLEEQRSMRLKQQADFHAAHRLAVIKIAELQSRIEALKSLEVRPAQKTRYTTTARREVIVEANAKRLELGMKENELRGKYGDDNKLTLAAKAEKETVEHFIQNQEETIAETVKGANPVHQQLLIDLIRTEAELLAQTTKAETLRGQLRQLELELMNLNANDVHIQDLKRRVDHEGENYVFFAERLEEARLADAMNVNTLSSISVVQAAVPPVEPTQPQKILSIVLAHVFGIICGVSCACVSETTDSWHIHRRLPHRSEVYTRLEGP